MKSRSNAFAGTAALAAVSLAFTAIPAHAAPATKAATGTDLTVLAAWDVLPGSGDIATWTGTSLGAGLTVGSNVSWGGIAISGALTNVGITGAGSITIGASGVTLTGNRTLTVANAVVLGSSQIWNIADVTGDTNTDATFGAISGGTFGITKTGAGTLSIGTSTYTGATVIDGGTLHLAGTNNSSGFTVNSGATLMVSGNFRIQGKNVTLNGGTFNNNNSFVEVGLMTMTDGTISPINGGYFRANSGYVLNGSNTISSGSSYINIDGNNSSGVFDVQSGTTTLGNIQTGQNGSNPTGLVKNGTGTLVLGNANSFTNKITVNVGTLQTNAAQALGNTSNAVTMANVSTAILNLNGFNQSIGSLTGGGTTGGNVSLGANAILSTGVNNTSTSYGGIISGTGTSGLTKVGTGTFTLTGASTYTGATTISGSGTLNLGGGTSTGSLASTILNLGGGTLSYTRTGSQTQTFTTTNITAGVNAVSVVSGDILNLGTITRTGGTIDFSSVGAGTVTALTGSNVNGSIPGATFGSTWAVANGAGTAITGLNSYTLTSVAGTTAGNYTNFNIDVDNSAGLLGGVISPNSLRFNTALANSVTLAAGSNVISSGILATSAAGNNLSTISGGNLTGAASSDLVIFQQNTSNGLTIGSAIVNNTATGLIKSGAGLLTLTGVNTYTGNTIIGAGTLDISGSGSLNSGNYSGTITDNGSLTYSSSATQTLGGVISGTGSLTKSGNSTLTLTGSNSYTGGTTISGGTLQVGTGTTGTIGTGPIVNNGTLAFNSTSFTIATTTGSGNITATQASGNMWLQGNITQSGSVAITTNSGLTSDGLRQSAVDNSNHINTSITAASISITGMIGALNDSGRTLTLDTSAVNGAITLDLQNGSTGRLYGVGINANAGTGTLTISGTKAGNTGVGSAWSGNANSLTGALNISSSFTVNNLSLTAKAASSVTGNLTLSGATNTFNSDVGITMAISGNLLTSAANPTFNKTGAGTVTLSGANTYAGVTTVSAGTLQVAKQISLYNNTPASWTAANINVKSGATLALNVDSAGTAGFTSASLNTLLTNISVAGSATQGLQSGAILGLDTSTATGASFTQGNVIANSTGTNGGAISLTKLGTGTLVLDKPNTYTGATLISGGTLMLGNGGTTGSLSTSSNITNNGTLNFNHSDNIVQGSAFGSLITGSGKVVQSGAGTTKLIAVNDFFGDTEVTLGTLEAGAADALKSTANVNVTGGTLLLSGSGNRVNDNAKITLSGATLNTGGLSETMGALSVGSGNSVIDLATGTSSVTFADSHLNPWTGLLAVWNWSGSLSGGGTDQLNFMNASGLTPAQISSVTFVNPAGLPAGTYGSQLLGTGELVPVPESSALLAGCLLLGVAGFQSRRSAVQQRTRRIHSLQLQES